MNVKFFVSLHKQKKTKSNKNEKMSLMPPQTGMVALVSSVGFDSWAGHEPEPLRPNHIDVATLQDG
jgi:hypothetical protein